MRSTPLRSDALLHLALGGLAVTGIAGLALCAGFASATAATMLAVYLAACGFVVLLVPGHAPHRRFGLANAVTLLRAGIVAVLAGFVGESDGVDEAARGALTLAALATLLLDGVDGWLARRLGLVSRFGARFDMEVDALTVLVLSLLVARTGQAGAWVVILGGLRYAALLSGQLFPVLAGELAPSWRRKTICVLSIAALIAALSPLVQPGAATFLCAAATILLIYSFGMDGILLVRGARGGIEVRPATS
jgi:phosphatidylglycerophosphate synthase